MKTIYLFVLLCALIIIHILLFPFFVIGYLSGSIYRGYMNGFKNGAEFDYSKWGRD